MSHSSVEVAYRPEGAGHRVRAARVDRARIPDPEAWLSNRLGPLASFEIRHGDAATDDASDTAHFDALASRLADSMWAALASRQTALEALAARLDAAAPAGSSRSATPTTTEETEA